MNSMALGVILLKIIRHALLNIEAHYFLYWVPPIIKFNVDCLYSKNPQLL